MFGDLLDLDFEGLTADDFDWSSLLADYGGEFGDMVLDTYTGEMVDASTIDPAELDYEFGDLPLAESPVSRSTSDHLRSLEADPDTPGSEPFDWTKMADPSASIASAGGGWGKALAQGLGKALGGLGGLAGVGGGGQGSGSGGGGGLSLPSGGLMTPDRVGGMPGTEAGGLPGLRGLSDLSSSPALMAALSRLHADPGARVGLQAPVDAGPAPVRFTPLAMPSGGGGGVPGGGTQAGPRMSGLQRLMLEKMG